MNDTTAPVITIEQPAGGWPTLAELIAREPAAFTWLGQPEWRDAGDAPCVGCGSPVSVCRCSWSD